LAPIIFLWVLRLSESGWAVDLRILIVVICWSSVAVIWFGTYFVTFFNTVLGVPTLISFVIEDLVRSNFLSIKVYLEVPADVVLVR